VSLSSRLIGLLGIFAALAMQGSLWAKPSPRTVHVFVALADNQHQGIIPVRPTLGNGDSPATNLYWGAAFGVKTYFRSSKDWRLVWSGPGPEDIILERCVFRFRDGTVYMVADAYRGKNIREAVTEFLYAAAGAYPQSATFHEGQSSVSLSIGSKSDLIAFVGHDAFMDFQIAPVSSEKGTVPRSVVVLACASKAYFAPYLKYASANPLLWTTGLMAPEAYTLKAALDGWIASEDGNSIRQRAAQAYDAYQHCGLRAAQRLFATGW
jgi:hypothetical protein